MKKNRSKTRPDKKIRDKKTVIRYFKTIVEKKYKDTLDVNEKGIPVIKGTDFTVSAYLMFAFFCGYSDKDLETAFCLKLGKEQAEKTREDVLFFNIDILEFLFKKEMEGYYDQLYAKEMCGYW